MAKTTEKNKKSQKKSLVSLINKPILKQKIVYSDAEKALQDFNFDDYTKVSYEDQTKLFNALKTMFVKLREDSEFMSQQEFETKYVDYLVELLELAVTGNVSAMDYLCFMYKKGIDGVMPVNLTLAHKWGMLAIANGSKLSVDRLRMFITPVLEFVEDSDLDIDYMLDRYDVEDKDAAYFIAQTFAGLYNPRMNITLLNMSREEPIALDSNFQKFMFDANAKRDEVLPDLLKYLK